MQKLSNRSKDISQENIKKVEELFPNCVTESYDGDGKLVRSIDFDILRQDLSDHVVEGPKERYQFNWPGKREAILLANSPTTNTLRPLPEKSVDFENTKNVYIEGDNLEALKILRETYMGRVDMIYIDPPYNTGNNLIYHNDFSESLNDFLKSSEDVDDENNRLFVNSQTNGRFHSKWCSMIYSRLLLCRSLLSEKGVIALTIDDNEIENITSIMNEIFGEENHLATIVIKNNPSGRSTVSGAAISHEYALFYGANQMVKLGRLPRNEKQISRYKEEDNVGKFEWVNFRKHGGFKEDAPTMFYPIFIKKDGSSFRIPKLCWDEKNKEYQVLEKPQSDELISLPIDENGKARRWKWGLERAQSDRRDMCVRLDKDKKPAIYIKSRMKDEGMLPLTVWDDKKYSSTEYGTNYLEKLLGEKYFDYPKSIFAVIDCLRIGNLDENSIVLDFFSGSATTAQAVMELNSEDGGFRKFVLVQLRENCNPQSKAYIDGYKTICDIGEERIRKSGRKIKEDSPLTTQDLDTGFRVFKIDSSNMKDILNTPKDTQLSLLENADSAIKPDRNSLDLVTQVMLQLGITLDAEIKIGKCAGGEYYAINGNDLICCFDKNISESDIEEIARMQPLNVAFRDDSFASDQDEVNCEQLFKTLSPNTGKNIFVL